MNDLAKHGRKRLFGHFTSACVAVLLIFGSSLSQAQTKEEVTFKEIKSLPRTSPFFKGERTYEVTVDFVSSQRKVLIVRDGTEKAILRFKEINDFKGYQVGNRLRVTGFLRRKSGRLFFECSQAVKIGQGKASPIKSLPEDPTRSNLREFNADRVRLSGRILTATQTSKYVQIMVQGNGYQYLVEGPAGSDDKIFAHIGGDIAVKGLFWFPFEPHLFDTPYDIPRVYFANRKALVLKGEPGSKSESISGEIVETFGDGRAFLQEPNKPTLTELKIFFRSDALPEGRFVKFWGHKWGRLGNSNIFTVSGFRPLRDSELPAHSEGLTPLQYRPGDSSQNRQQVTVEGDRIGDSQAGLQGGYFMLAPSEGGMPLRVVLPNSVSLIDKELFKAERLRVTGYLALDPAGPALFPRHFHEIEVLGKTPWVETAAFRWLAWGTLGLIFGGLVWVFLLRRLVKKRTEALDSSLGLLNASYDAVYEGICVIDGQGAVRKTNPRFWKMLGIAEVELDNLSGDELGARISRSSEKPEEFLALWNKLSNDREVREEGSLKMVHRENGEFRFYTVPAATSENKRELGRVWVFKDMTEQRRLESTLVQSQKMEAVGRLAGGVAHDFNNLLTGILGNLTIARLDPAVPVSEIEGPLVAAEQAGRRAAKLIKNLLGFSRQEKLSSHPSCVNAVVLQMVSLVRPTLNGKIDLQIDLEDDLHLAEFDPTRLEQVILNMVVNARDELGSQGGRISVVTQSVEAQHPETRLLGRYLRISVEDNGGGMSEEIRNRVFEPFFTTKEQGQGTGLGLATSYGTIKQMGGWIDCESEEGEGTIFRVYLSELEADLQGVASSEAISPIRKLPEFKRDQVEVLCVDDEEVVLQVAKGVLSRAGFRTSTAVHGRDALDLLAKRSAQGEALPEVIVTDLTMPVMDGKELLKEVRLAYPDILVIICSGYFVDCDEMMEGSEMRLDGFIQKPYEPDQMVAEIERLLLEQKLELSA